MWQILNVMARYIQNSAEVSDIIAYRNVTADIPVNVDRTDISVHICIGDNFPIMYRSLRNVTANF